MFQNKSTSACEAGEWHLAIWHPENPRATFKRIPFHCRSWRHAGPCREWKGAQDFVRVSEAMRTRKHWSYIVLTFAQRDWKSTWQQAKEGVYLWAKLRKRFVRAFGKMAYIQTWERHQKKGMHVNVALSNVRIAEHVSGLSSPDRFRWLIVNGAEVGFGRICWAEPLRHDDDTMAGYLTKLSRELTGAGPKNQIPVDAPSHFRRLRASRGLLPPPFKSEYTGRLVQGPLHCFQACADGVPRIGTKRVLATSLA